MLQRPVSHASLSSSLAGRNACPAAALLSRRAGVHQQRWAGSPLHRPPAHAASARRVAAGSAPQSSAANAVRAASSSASKGSSSSSSNSGGGGDVEDWQGEVVAAMAAAEGFAEVTIRAKASSPSPWHTAMVRPVALKGGRHLQVTVLTARQSASANHPAPHGDARAAAAALLPLLRSEGLASVALRTAAGDVAVQFTKRGRAIVHRTSPQARPSGPLGTALQGTRASGAPTSAGLASSGGGAAGAEPDDAAASSAAAAAASGALSHDRRKATPIPASEPHPFLQRIGFQTEDGRIRAHMQDKFVQVNDFLRLLSHTGPIRRLAEAKQQQQRGQEQPSAAAAAPLLEPEGASSSSSSSARALHILDCGCGSSHLSFGTYHYLNHVLGVPATMAGVDLNAQLMARANDNAAALGLAGRVAFEAAAIGDYTPRPRPDLVLALHACDTATDDALALAVRQAAPLLLAVPCCHAHLHKQLAGRPPSALPAPWGPLLGHPILRQRQLDLLTDALRAALLRVAGYKAEVVEFVSTEHTPRNLLIRAERVGATFDHEAAPAPAAEVGAERRSSSGAGAASGQRRPPGEPRGPAPRGAANRRQLAAAREYIALRDYWGVVPRLEVLLEPHVGDLLRLAEAEAAVASDGDEGDGVGGAGPAGGKEEGGGR